MVNIINFKRIFILTISVMALILINNLQVYSGSGSAYAVVQYNGVLGQAVIKTYTGVNPVTWSDISGTILDHTPSTNYWTGYGWYHKDHYKIEDSIGPNGGKLRYHWDFQHMLCILGYCWVDQELGYDSGVKISTYLGNDGHYYCYAEPVDTWSWLEESGGCT